jgi:hypothetical protein
VLIVDGRDANDALVTPSQQRHLNPTIKGKSSPAAESLNGAMVGRGWAFGFSQYVTYGALPGCFSLQNYVGLRFVAARG